MAKRSPRAALPPFVEPMLATLSPAFESAAHGYELKWDGFRALAFVDDAGVRLAGRRRTDFTARFPELLPSLAKLPKGTLLDGEIVHLTDGRPDFAALLGRERSWSAASPATRRARKDAPVTFVAFDLLYERYASVMPLPLRERRARLAGALAERSGPRLQMSELSEGNGLALFAEVGRLGLEGVVAKRLDAPYEPGQRGGAWLKFKRRQSAVCLILGYEPNATHGIKSLILASEIDGELQFIGQVGSGIGDEVGRTLLARFREESATSPVVPARIARGQSRARWSRPTMFCRVSFAEWTADGKLRQPVFESMYEPTAKTDEAGRPTRSPTPTYPRAPRGQRTRVDGE